MHALARAKARLIAPVYMMSEAISSNRVNRKIVARFFVLLLLLLLFIGYVFRSDEDCLQIYRART